MSSIPPEMRRANRRLLIGLIIFAILLCLTVLWWMRVTVRAKGGIVDPQFSHTSVEKWRDPRPLALEFSRQPI